MTSAATGAGARDAVAAQARAIAEAWSPPGAPPSWWLTAETLTAIAEDDVLLDLAAAVEPERLPALLLSAAIRYLVAEQQPTPLAHYYPRPGAGQPPPDDAFRPALRAFCAARADTLARLCATHRYQMNEVARCLDVLPALAQVCADEPRPLALVDLGTGAGLGLHLTRYHYTYDLPDGSSLTAGDSTSTVALSCTVRSGRPPVGPRLPTLAHRIGIDSEPLDLTDGPTAAWLAACVPPEIDAVTRFAAAAAIARADPTPTVRGHLLDALPDVVADLPTDTLLCLVDTYVHVFLPARELARFHELVDRIGRHRDLDWISIDPLVPLGPEARATVQGLDVPSRWLHDNRDHGVSGVISRISVRDGTRSARLLGRAHPGATWLEWTG